MEDPTSNFEGFVLGDKGGVINAERYHGSINIRGNIKSSIDFIRDTGMIPTNSGFTGNNFSNPGNIFVSGCDPIHNRIPDAISYPTTQAVTEYLQRTINVTEPQEGGATFFTGRAKQKFKIGDRVQARNGMKGVVIKIDGDIIGYNGVQRPIEVRFEYLPAAITSYTLEGSYTGDLSVQNPWDITFILSRKRRFKTII